MSSVLSFSNNIIFLPPTGMLSSILLYLDRFLFSLTIDNGPPLNLCLIEFDELLSFPAAPIFPNLSLPKVPSCLFILEASSSGLPKGTFSSYPSGTFCLTSPPILPGP